MFRTVSAAAANTAFVGMLLCGQAALAAEKLLEIGMLEKAPEIDGVIGVDEWAKAASRSDLLQASPIEFAAPSEETAWYFAYDETTLYVAAVAHYEDPSSIIANVLRQGASLGDDDSLNILVDGSNNKRNGYVFALNANGVRADAIFTNGVDQSDEWDGIWRGAATRTESGWAMEMAIPFNTVSFDPATDTWGLNFWRNIQRTDETIAWQSVGGDVNPTGSGEMSGLRNLDQGFGLDIVPALSGVRVKGYNGLDSDNELNPSLDLRYRFSPSISGLLTINTDFAATEVDNRQLGLDRFGVFFPEKRTFFLADFDIFQFGGIVDGGPSGLVGTVAGTNAMPFFSRRIGLGDDNQPVDIIAGGKLSGRTGALGFGALLIRQDSYDDIDATDLAVARVTYDILEESLLGAIATFGDPGSNDDNSVAGIDFRYRNTRIGNGRILAGNAWWQQSSSDAVSGDENAVSVAFALSADEGLSAGFQYQQVDEDYAPALGFVDRSGVRLYSLEAEHETKFRNSDLFQEFEVSARASRWEYLDSGMVQSETLQVIPLQFETLSGEFVRVWFRRHTEGLLTGDQPLDRLGVALDPGIYAFNRPGFFLRTARYRPLGFSLRANFGDFYNGERLELRPEVRWTPNRHLNTSLTFGFNRFELPGEKQITRQVTWNTEIAFNIDWSLITNVQYDNLSDDLGINARLRYNVAAGNDIWFVVNHNMRRDDFDDRFDNDQTTAVAKIRYTFRF
ncbi:MAG: hypothetical protein EX272_04195 [Chromatiales bacterium]|nr:MAG: hypothetical protein EX272_04195 [Chromatiales bacterium]